MGKMNLLKANWEGKVGQTVGAKWKDKSTLRTFTKPSNPKTEAQTTVRTAFSELTKFVALFSDQIKYLTALDTSGMSVRNAIIKLNKAMIDSGTVDLANLQISKGGLQKPAGFAVEKDASANTVKATWTAPTATNFTKNAKMVLVVVDSTDQLVDVFSADASAGTATGKVAFAGTGDVYVYGYYFDKRGTSKVGSVSVASKIA